MIQRIQSAFLLVGITLMLLFIKFPLSHIVVEDNSHFVFFSTGFKTSGDIITTHTQTIPLFSACIFSLALSIVSISLFKSRLLQMRLCIYNILILAFIIVLLAIYLRTFSSNNIVTSTSYTFWLVLPLLNIILHILAYRSIRKDENLVKSYDRLR